MDEKEIKRNICSRREALGLTQDDVALRLGISQPAYQKIEKGSTSLINKRIYEMASLLNTSPEMLVLGYESDQELIKQKTSELAEEYLSRLDQMKDIIDTKDKLINSLEQRLIDKDRIIDLQMEMIKRMRKILNENQIDEE